MVYIKLKEQLYKQLSPHISAQKMIKCEEAFYISYPQLKRVAVQQKLKVHKQISRTDILTYSEMDLLVERSKQTPLQRKMIEQLKNKRELRLLNKINPSKDRQDYYFQAKQEGNGMKQMTESISFSMAFIFTFFMAGLTGYYVGAYFLGWELVASLLLALGFIMCTLLLETTLFMIRQAKKNTIKKQNISNRSKSEKIVDSDKKKKSQ